MLPMQPFLSTTRRVQPTTSVMYFQILQRGVACAAAHYRVSGEFVQVFPTRLVFADKASWVRFWALYGGEEVVAHISRLEPRAALKSP
jgi:hypothetical protein